MILTQQQCLTKSTGGRDGAVFILIIVKYVNDRSQQQYKILTLKFFTTLSIYRYSKQFESSCEGNPELFFHQKSVFRIRIHFCILILPFIHMDISYIVVLFQFLLYITIYCCSVSVPVIHTVLYSV